MSCLDVLYKGAYQPYQYPFYQRPSFAQKLGRLKMEETMGMDNAMEFNATAAHNRYATVSHPTHSPSLSAFTSAANQHHPPLPQPPLPLPQPTPLPPHQQHRHHFHHPAASTCTLYTGHSSTGSSSSATSSCSNSNGSRSGSSKGISGGCMHGQSAVDLSPNTASISSLAAPAQTVSGVKEEHEPVGGCREDTMPEADVDYVNSRCVIFTFFSGDLDKIVDEHFSRSLSQQGSFHSNENLNKNGSDGVNNCEDTANQNDVATGGENSMDNWPTKNEECQPTPMCQRNFPPSFWNANFYSNAAYNNINNINNMNTNGMQLNCNMYPTNGAMGAQPHPQDPSAYLSAAAAAVAAAADYSALNMHHHHAAHAAQTEAWHYASGFQPTHRQMAPPYVRAHHPTTNYHHAHHHSPGLHNFRYGGISAAAAAAAGSAFSPRYSSLLIQPSVTPSRLPTIPGQGEFPVKSMAMSEWPTFTPHSHQSSGTDGPPTYAMDTGAAALDSYEANKDLFWF